MSPEGLSWSCNYKKLKIIITLFGVLSSKSLDKNNKQNSLYLKSSNL